MFCDANSFVIEVKSANFVQIVVTQDTAVSKQVQVGQHVSQERSTDTETKHQVHLAQIRTIHVRGRVCNVLVEEIAKQNKALVRTSIRPKTKTWVGWQSRWRDNFRSATVRSRLHTHTPRPP